MPRSLMVYADLARRGDWSTPLKVPGTANGGLHEFADGGFATGIYKGGVPIHKFAEPETRWEAYISGKPGQEDRNRQIWVETGRRLGVGDGIAKAVTAAIGSGGRGGVQIGSVAFQSGSQRQQFRDFEDSIDRAARRLR
ncbi:MAG: hypothetical protein IPQ22_17030 [Rhodoferax sp.]|nr:hypothetical protein [Rhodoferax sp.]